MIETVRYRAAILEKSATGEKVVHTCSTAKLDAIPSIDRSVQEFMESLQRINPGKTYVFVPDYGELYAKGIERIN